MLTYTFNIFQLHLNQDNAMAIYERASERQISSIVEIPYGKHHRDTNTRQFKLLILFTRKFSVSFCGSLCIRVLTTRQVWLCMN